MSAQVFEVSQATGNTVEAPAVVSSVPFSARYDLDRVTGLITRVNHPLRGHSVVGKILISPGVQGGVAAGWALLAMKGRGVGFAGLIFTDTNPVMVQGAVTAGIPIAAGVDSAVFQAVHSGDIIRLDPVNKSLSIVS